MQRRHIATSQMGDAVVPTPQSQATCRAPCNHSLGSLIRVSLSVPKGQAKTGTSRQTTHPAASATPPDRRDSRRGRELNVEILRTERSVGRSAGGARGNASSSCRRALGPYAKGRKEKVFANWVVSRWWLRWEGPQSRESCHFYCPFVVGAAGRDEGAGLAVRAAHQGHRVRTDR